MIYVNQKQLDQVEYLIEQSTRGHHILFDNDILRKVFANSNPRRDEKHQKKSSKKIASDVTPEKHIENIILQPTLIAKKAYLENLNPKILHQVVETYFSIVENNIFESSKYNQ